MSAVGRFCCKTPKSLGTNFLVKKLRLVPSPINRAPSSLPKSPVSLPPENEVPQISIQKSHQQPRKILVCSGKGLLQQNRFKSGLQSGYCDRSQLGHFQTSSRSIAAPS